MSDLIHSSHYKPRIFSVKGDVEDAEIDRAQSIDVTGSLNREKVEEIGRENPVGYIKKSPTVPYRLMQYENGSIEFWQKLVNSATLGASGQTAITLNDFKTPYFDICAYLTDDADVFKGTVWYPALRTTGFSFTIGDPQAIIERSFDFVGESARVFQGDNKYLIYNRHECGSGSDNEIDLSAKEPAELPTDAGTYMLRVVRVRGTASTELVDGTDFSYSSVTKVLTVTSVQTGDVIKSYYTSATAPATQFTENDSDPAGIVGDSVSIYLYIPASGSPSSSDYVYRLQSVTITVSFTREDLREIGNKNVVARGVNDSVVTVTLGSILNDFSIEEVLAGQASDFGDINIENFTDEAVLIVKVFSDNTKGTFKYGIKASGLTPTDVRLGAGVNAYVAKDNTLEGEVLAISADASVIGI